MAVEKARKKVISALAIWGAYF